MSNIKTDIRVMLSSLINDVPNAPEPIYWQSSNPWEDFGGNRDIGQRYLVTCLYSRPKKDSEGNLVNTLSVSAAAKNPSGNGPTVSGTGMLAKGSAPAGSYFFINYEHCVNARGILLPDGTASSHVIYEQVSFNFHPSKDLINVPFSLKFHFGDPHTEIFGPYYGCPPFCFAPSL